MQLFPYPLIQAVVGAMVGTSLVQNLIPKFRKLSFGLKFHIMITCSLLSYWLSPILTTVLLKYGIDINKDQESTLVVAIVLSLGILPLFAFVNKVSDLDGFMDRITTVIGSDSKSEESQKPLE